MIYYRKNDKHENPDMPFPEDFDILFFGDCGKSKKTKIIFRRIAVIFAVCTKEFSEVVEHMVDWADKALEKVAEKERAEARKNRSDYSR